MFEQFKETARSARLNCIRLERDGGEQDLFCVTYKKIFIKH